MVSNCSYRNLAMKLCAKVNWCLVTNEKLSYQESLKRLSTDRGGEWQREKEEEEEKEGRRRGGGGDRWESARLVVQIFCFNRDTEGGYSVLFYLHLRMFLWVSYDSPHTWSLVTVTSTSHLVFQNLRAQEAAQAEVEDREDLEIAAEVAGIELHQTSMCA